MTLAHPDIIPFPGRLATSPLPESGPQVLIVCADLSLSQRWSEELQASGFATRAASSVESALQWLQSTPAEVCLVGPLSPTDSVSTIEAAIQRNNWPTQLLTQLHEVTATGPALSISCGWIPQPVAVLQVSWLVAAASQQSRLSGEVKKMRRQLSNRNLREMVGHSPAMQQLRDQVQQQAEQAEGCLIQGERGSGITQVALGIHEASKRAHRPFVTVDCSVHSAETLEEELFGTTTTTPGVGHTRQPGRLELADGGTLLLENVDTIAIPLQRRLATVLNDQRFEHESTGERVRFDVRVIFGTCIDLDDQERRGLFRTELLAHGGQRRITIPTLRSRSEDVAPLAESFLRKIAAREGMPPRSLTLDALHRLQSYNWPGNMSELEHVIERACTVNPSRKLTAAMLEPWLGTGLDDEPPAGLTLATMERQLIESTFARFAGNREKTAKTLQIGIRTLSGKLREYGYPPRGGPGSNLKAWTPTTVVYPEDAAEQRAA
ncbi:sigma-54-dependent Fis family transcriptional regulator [bacterium]|nr:sigma-54-dependent Fis family transcriptional regulator [bacterium]